MLIAGSDEMAKGQAAVKDLETKQQVLVPVESIDQYLADRVKAV